MQLMWWRGAQTTASPLQQQVRTGSDLGMAAAVEALICRQCGLLLHKQLLLHAMCFDTCSFEASCRQLGVQRGF
jgi:hypothetical protein